MIRPSIVLPTMPAGANPEGIEAAAETAARLGWHTAWTTDHLLMPGSAPGDYPEIYDVLMTLGWVGARHPSLRLGTSVIVVPMRNPIALAKQIASLDSLSGGRVIAGVGVGWNEVEFGNVGEADRFRVRGAFVDEVIGAWRHLFSGSREPLRGQFLAFEDFSFGPLPAQRDRLPIVVGGSHPRALLRAGRLADGFHASSASPARVVEMAAVVRAAAEEAGRPEPSISARVSVRFAGPKPASYALFGSPDEMLAEIRAFDAAGVDDLSFAFGQTDAERVRNDMERLDREVLAALR